MLVLHDPATFLHSTVELVDSKLIPALESPERVRAILSALEASSHELRTIHVDPNPNTTSGSGSNVISLVGVITKTHDKGYIHHLQDAFTDWLNADLVKLDESILPECFRFTTHQHPKGPPHPPKDISARLGYYAFDMSSGLMSESYTSILASANLAHEGTQILFSPNSSLDAVLALTRPPGHHCDGRLAGGYCYVNNAAVAVSTFHSLHPKSASQSTSSSEPKIAILDLDFHHGNGTQEIFYSSPSTLYVSIHGEDEFPYYTGSASETGVAEGEGYNLNLPLPTNSSFSEYRKKLEVALKRINGFNPEFVIISLGFDTFHLDPLGKFGIETEDYAVMAGMVRECVRELDEEGRVGDEKEMGKGNGKGSGNEVKCLILLEGGYVIERLGENVLSFLRGWEGS